MHSKESLERGGCGAGVAAAASECRTGIGSVSGVAVVGAASAEKGSRRTPSCSPWAMAAMPASPGPNDTADTRLSDCDADPPRDHVDVDVDRLALALLLVLLWLLTLQLGVTSVEKPAGVVDRLSEETALAAAAAAAAATAGDAFGSGMAALETLRLLRLDDAALRVCVCVWLIGTPLMRASRGWMRSLSALSSPSLMEQLSDSAMRFCVCVRSSGNGAAAGLALALAPSGSSSDAPAAVVGIF